jgi:hypothetical protein
MLVGTCGAHSAQAPVGGGGVDAWQPRMGVLRCSAVRILRAEALAGLRMNFGSAHLITSLLQGPFSRACGINLA